MNFNRLFAFLVILLLSLELLAPYALAQVIGQAGAEAASARQGAQGAAVVEFPPDSQQRQQGTAAQPVINGACSLTELSSDEASAILQQTRDFKAKEVNSLSGSALLENDPDKNLEKDRKLNINNFIIVPQPGEGIQLGQFMQLTAIDGSKKNIDLIRGIVKRDVVGSDFITLVEANAIAERFGKDPSDFKQLIAAFSGKTNEAPSGPLYANYKVKLPNGLQVPYSQLAALEEIKPDACLLNSAHLQGRAYYMGRLDQDAIIARNDAIGSKKAPNTFSSETATANFALNGADSLVVPQKYLEYVTEMKTWMMIDFFLSAIETGHLFTGVQEIKKGQSQLEDLLKQKSIFNPEPFYLNSITERPVKNLGLRLIGNREINADDAIRIIDDEIPNLGGALPPFYTNIRTELETLRNGMHARGLSQVDEIKETRKLLDRYENTIYEGARFSQTEINEVTKYKNRLIYDNKVSDLSEKLSKQKGFTKTELDTLKGRLNKMNGWLGYRLVFGYMWMGPARLALQLAEGLVLFTVDGRPFRDAYILIHVNKNNLLSDFRTATNWMMSGTVMDAIADLTEQGVPTDAFNTGKVIVINSPNSEKDQVTLDNEESETSFTGVENKGWNVNTQWIGDSTAVFFEDVKNSKKYAHLSIQAKNTAVYAGFNSEKGTFLRGKELSSYFTVLKVIFPIIGWALVDRSGTPLTTILRIYAYDLMFGDYDNIITDVLRPDKIKPGEKCDDKVIQQHINYYKYWTAAQHAVNFAYVLKPWIKSFELIKKALSNMYLSKAVKYAEFIGINVAPGTLAQGFAATQGMEYVSNCKDDTTNIITWQNLQAPAATSSLSKTLTSVSTNDFTSKLNLGQAFGGVGTKLTDKQLSEFVNLKTAMKNQNSKSNFDDLYYVHLQNVNKQFWNNPQACASQCFDSKKIAVCFGDGLEICNKEKKKCEKFSDKTRAKDFWEDDALGYVFLPNKMITASIASCSNQEVLNVNYLADLKLSTQCKALECLRSQLSTLAGKQLGTDLSSYIGEVTAIYTEKGKISFSKEGVIAFSPFTTDSQVRSPSVEALEKSLSTTQDEVLKQAGSVSINGQGKVTLLGFLEDDTQVKEHEAGELKTLFTKRGRIDYNSFTGNIDVFVQSLASINARDIKDFVTDVNKCQDGSFKVKIDRFIGKSVIGDKASQDLNNALKEWMKTCDKEAFYFEDSNGNKYELTKDGRLVVSDKDGNKIAEYKVNNAYKDGKDLVFDTDKGPVRMSLGMNENGQPVINVNYPDRDSTGGLLKLLGGLGGALVYNPATGQWELANGLPFGLSPDFTKFGQTIKQDSDGNVRGLPISNIFALPPEQSRRGTANPLAALPSWPEENLATILIILLILGMATVVRLKKIKN